MPEDLMENRLGRLYVPDARDENFPMSSLLPSESAERKYRYWWSSGWWGDQGYTPQCVAYSWLHWTEDGPITHAPREAGEGPVVAPSQVYYEAQKVDQWPGENYDGTSVRAGAKILQKYGYISAYTWAWDVNTVVKALLTTGPVVVGTWWHRDMFYPNEEGMITPTGGKVGGHAYLLNGVNTETGIIRIKNSWGRNWGKKGFAYISIENMDKLIRDYGEACLATEVES